jgi:hypothetical protein
MPVTGFRPSRLEEFKTLYFNNTTTTCQQKIEEKCDLLFHACCHKKRICINCLPELYFFARNGIGLKAE